MYQINGWIVIREAFNEKNEDDLLLDEIIEKIKSKVDKFKTINEFYDIYNLNGSWCISFGAAHNHRYRDNDRIIEFFKWIGKIAVGSYGLLHIHDDEDIELGNENNYMVWRMAKGIITEHVEEKLSPVISELEE